MSNVSPKGIPITTSEEVRSPDDSPASLVSAAAMSAWPPEAWDIEQAVDSMGKYTEVAVPGELFAIWVQAGYESLLASIQNDRFSIEVGTFAGLEHDSTLATAVFTIQDVAYRDAGSMSLAIMASARFLALVKLHRSGDLFPLFPLEGEVYDGPYPHWSFIAAAAQLDLWVQAGEPEFDADQLRFLAMACADFDNPWSWKEPQRPH